jgi:hypothetical protein
MAEAKKIASAREDKTGRGSPANGAVDKEICPPMHFSLSLHSRSTDRQRHRGARTRPIAMRADRLRPPLTILIVAPRFL